MAAVVLLTVSVLLTGGLRLSAQSLVGVAEQEAERRKAVASPAKLYTNADILDSGHLTVSAPQPTAPEPHVELPHPAASGPSVGAAKDEPPAAAATPDEKLWRSRVADTRVKLERAKLFLDALQSRVNGLAADFAARDDPAQRAVIAGEREKALAEMDRVRVEISGLTQELANIEEDARRTGVPPGWLRQ